MARRAQRDARPLHKPDAPKMRPSARFAAGAAAAGGGWRACLPILLARRPAVGRAARVVAGVDRASRLEQARLAAVGVARERVARERLPHARGRAEADGSGVRHVLRVGVDVRAATHGRARAVLVVARPRDLQRAAATVRRRGGSRARPLCPFGQPIALCADVAEEGGPRAG
eukprot:1130789-Prymnesium_polylepis.2